MKIIEFKDFEKIPRLNRNCYITEKIDGTNCSILIQEDGTMSACSRNGIITSEYDHHGFAKWVSDNHDDLLKLGKGQHFGEWYGNGINREYGLNENRFALFNTARWGNPDDRPKCCECVPLLACGTFFELFIEGRALNTINDLRVNGSVAVKGYKNPEGVIVYFESSDCYFKYTLKNDSSHKTKKTVL